MSIVVVDASALGELLLATVRGRAVADVLGQGGVEAHAVLARALGAHLLTADARLARAAPDCAVEVAAA